MEHHYLPRLALVDVHIARTTGSRHSTEAKPANDNVVLGITLIGFTATAEWHRQRPVVALLICLHRGIRTKPRPIGIGIVGVIALAGNTQRHTLSIFSKHKAMCALNHLNSINFHRVGSYSIISNRPKSQKAGYNKANSFHFIEKNKKVIKSPLTPHL